MTIVKSYCSGDGDGDMFYIRHNSDNFTRIDCSILEDLAVARTDLDLIARLVVDHSTVSELLLELKLNDHQVAAVVARVSVDINC